MIEEEPTLTDLEDLLRDLNEQMHDTILSDISRLRAAQMAIKLTDAINEIRKDMNRP